MLLCFGPRGLATIVGALPPGEKVELNAGHFFVEKRIQVCYIRSNRFPLDIPKYLELYRQGRLNPDDMISRRSRLEEVNEAFRAMEAGEVTRRVLMFN